MIDPLDLSGRSIVVTGASSGIGRATAILLSELGARIALLARDEGRLQESAHLLKGTGHRVVAVDLGVLEALPGIFKSLSAECGPLHGLVHAAGVQSTRPLRFQDVGGAEELLRINLLSALFLAKAFRQRGVCAGESSIVFLSSVMGLVGMPGVSVYSASKGALISATRSLAVELAREGIRVNCVAPGHVRSEMAAALADTLTPEQWAEIEARYPLGLGTPADVAQAVAFLVSGASRWITGTTLVVDGGLTAS